ncbi:hypothetical protein [Paenibacillus sp. MMO-177]
MPTFRKLSVYGLSPYRLLWMYRAATSWCGASASIRRHLNELN